MKARGLLALVVLLPLRLSAQGGERVRAGVFAEEYRFGSGHVVDRISEIAFPLTLSIPVGRRANLVLSTGHATVTLTGSDPAVLGRRRLSGPLDTEMRLSVDLVPGRVVAFATGTIPTGQQTVFADDIPVLVTVTNDVIGFAMPALGSGGAAGSGFSAAFPVGRIAIGLAATGTYAFAYAPVAGQSATLRPGHEARVRLAIEGPLAPRTFFRLTGSVAARTRDVVAGSASHGVGHRSIGYASLEQSFGRATLTAYAFDVLRGSPQLEPSAVGAAILPRGNLFAAGLTLSARLGPLTIVPRGEFRTVAAALSLQNPTLARQGTAIRAGLDLRGAIRKGLSFTLQADALTGHVLQGATSHDLRGYRGSIMLEAVP